MMADGNFLHSVPERFAGQPWAGNIGKIDADHRSPSAQIHEMAVVEFPCMTQAPRGPNTRPRCRRPAVASIQLPCGTNVFEGA